MANGIRTGDPRGFNKGRSSKFREGSRVRQTPEEGRRTYRPKRCGNNNKDEDNSPKTLNDKNQQTSSQKFRQLRKIALNIQIGWTHFASPQSILDENSESIFYKELRSNHFLSFLLRKEIHTELKSQLAWFIQFSTRPMYRANSNFFIFFSDASP